ncbi:hypothetical protein LOAG_12655 [Loa loa]|uniref:Uncharacterized protein n=1 Tax=Loa loa TaxID=7209 RepID=A0A1S0TLX2_LOALO|nr:hypothetical protein LOAG_12655 [Loa loa]EFO15854.1 hypothetical protein LOAG_12655 [Loa loa]
MGGQLRLMVPPSKNRIIATNCPPSVHPNRQAQLRREIAAIRIGCRGIGPCATFPNLFLSLSYRFGDIFTGKFSGNFTIWKRLIWDIEAALNPCCFCLINPWHLTEVTSNEGGRE